MTGNGSRIDPRYARRVARRSAVLAGRGVAVAVALTFVLAVIPIFGFVALSESLTLAAEQSEEVTDELRPARPEDRSDDQPSRTPQTPTTALRASMPDRIAVDQVGRRIPLAVSFGARDVARDHELAIEVEWVQHEDGFATGQINPRQPFTVTVADLPNFPMRLSTNVAPICDEPVGTVVVTVTEADDARSVASAAAEVVGPPCDPDA